MYINTSKIATSKIVNALIIVLCALPLFINVLFLYFLFTVTTDEQRIAAVILAALFIFFTVSEIGIIIWRSFALHRISRCRLYNSIFEEDHDGIITYDSIASMKGFKVQAVIRDLMWFVKRHYLINVTLGRTAARVDLLSDEKEFQTVVCPSCGAHVNIRKNGGGKCEHCGTFMRLKGEQNV